MRKYTIEISKNGIKKTFIDGKKKYKEVWVRDGDCGSRTSDLGITSQLDQYGDFNEDELIDLLDQDDIDGLWNYFVENEELEHDHRRGNLIKHLAICEKCNTELLSKYESGIWGFSKLMRDEKNNLYTKCFICENEKRYPINSSDVEEILSGNR